MTCPIPVSYVPVGGWDQPPWDPWSFDEEEGESSGGMPDQGSGGESPLFEEGDSPEEAPLFEG